MSFATYSSPRCSSIARPVGQSNCVFGPWITRSGETVPCALMLWTMIDGGRLLPEPGTAEARSNGQFCFCPARREARASERAARELTAPWFAMKTQPFFESSAMPCGSASPVASPCSRRSGDSSFSAYLRNTTIALSCCSVRNISSEASSTAMPNVPCGVCSSRVGGTSPLALRSKITRVSTVSLLTA